MAGDVFMASSAAARFEDGVSERERIGVSQPTPTAIRDPEHPAVRFKTGSRIV